MVQVVLFTWSPILLPLEGVFRVGTGPHEREHARSEARFNLTRNRPVVILILNGVVQKRGDGRLLTTAMLHHERGDGHEVGRIGDRCPLPSLVSVELARIVKRCHETRGGGETRLRSGVSHTPRKCVIPLSNRICCPGGTWSHVG